MAKARPLSFGRCKHCDNQVVFLNPSGEKTRAHCAPCDSTRTVLHIVTLDEWTGRILT